MYLTYEELISIYDKLLYEADHEKDPAHQARLRIAVLTVVGLIKYVEMRADAENDEKCPKCEQWHSDLNN